jgi:hypothetical protein
LKYIPPIFVTPELVSVNNPVCDKKANQRQPLSRRPTAWMTRIRALSECSHMQRGGESAVQCSAGEGGSLLSAWEGCTALYNTLHCNIIHRTALHSTKDEKALTNIPILITGQFF